MTTPQAIPAIPALDWTTYCVWQDSGHWFAVRGDYATLEKAVMGFGETPCEAIENLMEELAREERGGV